MGKTHFNFLDGLRGLAALAVLLLHVGQDEGFYRMPFAGLAVDFFFLLSGFVIGHAYEARLLQGLSVRRFLRLRVVRLYPMIALGTIMGLTISAARVVIVGDVTPGQLLSLAVSSLLVLPSYALPQYTIAFPANIAMWSLFFELAANLAYALIVTRLTDRMLLAICGVSFAGLVFLAVTFGTIQLGSDRTTLYGGLFRVGFSFFAGLYLFRVRPVRPIVNAWGAPGLALGFCALLLWIGARSGLADVLIVGVVFPLLLIAASNAAVIGTLGRACRVLGGLSYPLYAVHAPILRAISEARDRVGLLRIHPAATMAIEVVIALGAAWLALVCYDEPVRRWLARRRDAHRAEAPAIAADRPSGWPQ